MAPGQPRQSTRLQGAELWRGVCETYDAAQRSGAAASIDTQSEVLPDAGIEFVIRLATALRAKPKGDVQSGVPAAAAGASGGKAAAAGAASQPAPAPPPRNPFLPPDPALTVGHLSATHTLLLNKCVTRTSRLRAEVCAPTGLQTGVDRAASVHATWPRPRAPTTLAGTTTMVPPHLLALVPLQRGAPHLLALVPL